MPKARGALPKRFEVGNAETWGDVDCADVVTLMFALHEMPQEGRRAVLTNALQLARRRVVVSDICLDYTPSPLMLTGEPFVLDYLAHADEDVRGCAAATGGMGRPRRYGRRRPCGQCGFWSERPRQTRSPPSTVSAAKTKLVSRVVSPFLRPMSATAVQRECSKLADGSPFVIKRVTEEDGTTTLVCVCDAQKSCVYREMEFSEVPQRHLALPVVEIPGIPKTYTRAGR